MVSIHTKHIYKYYDVNGSHIANKVRNTSTKQMWTEGSNKKLLCLDRIYLTLVVSILL